MILVAATTALLAVAKIVTAPPAGQARTAQDATLEAIRPGTAPRVLPGT